MNPDDMLNQMINQKVNAAADEKAKQEEQETDVSDKDIKVQSSESSTSDSAQASSNSVTHSQSSNSDNQSDSNFDPFKNVGQSNPSNSSSDNNASNSSNSSSSSTNDSEDEDITAEKTLEGFLTGKNKSTKPKDNKPSEPKAKPKHKSAPMVKPHVKSVRFAKIKRTRHVSKHIIHNLEIQHNKLKEHKMKLQNAGAPKEEITACTHQLLAITARMIDDMIFEARHHGLLRKLQATIHKQYLATQPSYTQRIKALHKKIEAVNSASASAKAKAENYQNNLKNLESESMRAQDNKFTSSLTATFRSKHPSEYDSEIALLHNYYASHPFNIFQANHSLRLSRTFSNPLKSHYIKSHNDVNTSNYNTYRHQRAHQLQSSAGASILSSMASIPFEQRKATHASYVDAYKSYMADKANWNVYSPVKQNDLYDVLAEHDREKEYDNIFFKQWAHMKHIPVSQARSKFKALVNKAVQIKKDKKKKDSSN